MSVLIHVQVISPALAALLFGWFLVVVFFGKVHTDYVRDLKERRQSDDSFYEGIE